VTAAASSLSVRHGQLPAGPSTSKLQELWKGRLPAGGQATPMTYYDNAQKRHLVVIAAGGHGGLGTKQGLCVAFALPDHNDAITRTAEPNHAAARRMGYSFIQPARTRATESHALSRHHVRGAGALIVPK